MTTPPSTFRAASRPTQKASASATHFPNAPGPFVANREGRYPARYEYHYNRNALRASVVLGDIVIGLTEAGHLLQFALPDWTFRGEKLSAVPFVALGNAVRGGVLAARSDGTVSIISVDSLAEETILVLPGEPTWIYARTRDGELQSVLALLKRKERTEDESGVSEQEVDSVFDSSTSTQTDLPEPVDVAYLDSRSRLWLGADNGEFGGWIGRFDPTSGRLFDYGSACRSARISELPIEVRLLVAAPDGEPEEGCDGVYGFRERSTGEILAFGGLDHMGFRQGFVLRLTEGSVEFLAQTGQTWQRLYRKEEPPESEPRGPITQLLETSDDEILGFSYGSVYGTTSDFRTWTNVADIELRSFFGRPDAVGAYPAIVDVTSLGAEPPLLLTTQQDGFVVLRGDDVHGMALPGQLEATRVVRVGNTPSGPIYFDGTAYSGIHPPWRRRPTWERLDLSPGVETKSGTWILQTAFVSGSGSIVSVFETSWTPGERATVQWVDGNQKLLARERMTGWGFWSSFETPDGRWWAREKDSLFRFDRKKWIEVGRYPEACGYCTLQVVGGQAPRWLLHDARGKTLWGLDASDLDSVAIRPILDLEVRAAVSLGASTFLLATDRGLKTFDATTNQIDRFRFEAPEDKIASMAKDAAGRVWIGGDRLWMLDEKAGQFVDMSPSFLLPGASITLISGDARSADGVVVSLGTRGLLFVESPVERPGD